MIRADSLPSQNFTYTSVFSPTAEKVKPLDQAGLIRSISHVNRNNLGSVGQCVYTQFGLSYDYN